MAALRAWVFAVCVVAAVGGIALGAESQKETFLKDENLDSGVGGGFASGNLIFVTAFIPAFAASVCALLAGTTALRQRLLGAWAVGFATYLLVLLIQTAWPSYITLTGEGARIADFSIASMFANFPAVGSVYLAPFAFVVGAILVGLWGARNLRPLPSALATPEQLLRRHVTVVALATPFLLVASAGNVRVLAALPAAQPAAQAYFVVLPLLVLAMLGLVGVGIAKAIALGRLIGNSRLSEATREAWELLKKAEWALAGAIGGLALVGFFLRGIDLEVLQSGRVLGWDARVHTVLQFLVAVPLVPWLLLHREAGPCFDAEGPSSLDVRTHPLAIAALITLCAGAAITVALSFAPQPLVVWVGALVPATVLAWLAQPNRVPLPGLLLVITLWGMGSTISGRFAPDSNEAIVFDTAIGWLALARVAAVALLGVLLVRMAVHRLASERRLVVWPVALSLAIGAALIVFLLLPLTAWLDSIRGLAYVGIGSVVASQATQSSPVRAMIHIVAHLSALGFGFAAARLLRPDWFQQRGSPVPTLATIPAG